MNARRPLTRIQRQVLSFVESYVGRHGYAPSLRDINDHFGWSSQNAAGQHLLLIEKKGYIRRTPSISRGIVIL